MFPLSCSLSVRSLITLLRLLFVLPFVVANMFAQPNDFGPVSTHLKAGDFAPVIVFTRILNAADASSWTAESLSGKVTVLVFYPDTSHNLQSVSRWNALVGKFSSKPIQFVWITGEKESSLLPWLQEHSVKGWVLYDSDGATGRAYGLETAAAVIIGADRRIVGFDQPFVPEEATIRAVLEGRISTAPVEPTFAAIKAFAESGMVRLSAEPPGLFRPVEYKPDFPPSYTVHISPAKNDDSGDFSGDAYRNFQGFALKDVLADIYGINPIRIHLPASMDGDQRYNIALVLPKPESNESVHNRILQGIQEHFGVVTTREELLLDVYVVTTANGKPPTPLARSDDDQSFGGFSSSSLVEVHTPPAVGNPDDFPDPRKPIALGDIRGISLEGTLDDFCRTLEHQLDRPVVNETNMKGEYEFRLQLADGAGDDFLARLRDRYNLSITPAQRRVEIVTLKPR
jgi:uncharacterized protein (TIGR03435 family)